ncbi:hypothetical protein N665_0046s0021 [Sinapis alba]|nr:hypothetical protein N665_0046s0021 [Sinapis alba]
MDLKTVLDMSLGHRVPFVAEWFRTKVTSSSGCLLSPQGSYALFQLQEEMKRQLSAVGNYTEKELEEYMTSNKKVMNDSLWKLTVADIESTLSRVCKLVLQDPTAKREELRARVKGLKTLGRSSNKGRGRDASQSTCGPQEPQSPYVEAPKYGDEKFN